MFDASKVRHRNFHYKQEVTSTNDVVLNFANQGCDEFSCCLAEVQTKGRGRLQRVWQTYPYKSLAFSFVLYDFIETMPLVLCCSMHRILKEKYQSRVAIKWPNDIYYNNSKLSGILVESFPLANKQQRAYIVGVGLNIFTDDDRLDMVGFLDETTNVEISREELFNDLLSQIKQDITTLKNQGFEQFKNYFMQNCLYKNQIIDVMVGNKVESGKFIDINDDGYLILKQKEVILSIPAGQIVQKK